MNRVLEEMGPVDYMVVEFPGGRMSGEGLPLLVDLVDRGIIRIIDLVFLRKMPNGSIVRIELSSLGDGLDVFEGASSGLLDQEDLEAAGAAIETGSTAGIIVFENRWAAPLAVALRRGGAIMVANGRIPIQSVLGALDAAEAQAASSKTR